MTAWTLVASVLLKQNFAVHESANISSIQVDSFKSATYTGLGWSKRIRK